MSWKFTGEKPVYQQIMDRVRSDIVRGRLAAGGRIPAVRELAMIANVNPNTMQRALQELERAGLVMSCRTSGRFVTEDVSAIETGRLALAQKHVTEFVFRMQELGYDHAGICALIEQERSGDDGTDSGVS